MKLLTITVPSYNVEKTLADTLESFCIDKILDDLDIVVVDDGSKDKTAEIAGRYARKYPSSFRVISKRNGGHGSAVNAGVQAAAGKYFKVVDGDDRLEKEGLIRLVERLGKTDSDIVACPYRKVPVNGEKPVLMEFENVEPGRIYRFDELPIDGKLYFGIHSLTIRTSLLQDNGLKLQEHTFYVDVEYALLPIPFVKTAEFLSCPVYLYYVGSAGQSINTANFVKRYDDHYRVVRRMVDYAAAVSCTSAQHAYMLSVLNKLCFTQYMLCAFYDSDKHRGKMRAREFDAWLRGSSPELYRNLSGSSYIRVLRMIRFRILPGNLLKKIAAAGYGALKPLARKRRKFTY